MSQAIRQRFIRHCKPKQTMESKGISNDKDLIDFDSFQQMELRVGQIIAAQKVPKTDKLLQFEVNIGSEVRTILSGIAQHYSPDEVIGKQVAVLVNLAPRKIRGIESQGMLLLAEDESGNLIFMGPESDTNPGAPIS